jgi:hypothetical protein
LDHSSLDRIVVYVADHSQQVVVVFNAFASVTTLKDVTASPVFTVIPPGVTGANPAHDTRYRIGFFPNQQMNMVRHQAVSVNRKLIV